MKGLRLNMRERRRCDPTPGERCPRCRAQGPIVGVAPVRAHRLDATSGGWQYCNTSGCRVVFYLVHESIDEDEVIARVGVKACPKPEPVCYCFAKTAFSIAMDLETNDGMSTITRSIEQAISEQLCACEHLNPCHTCCLPDVRRTIETIRRFTTL
jgi:hypothetical protein